MLIPSGERETLEQLRGDEAVLEREVLAARQEVAAALERAHHEAETIAAEGLAETERELHRLRGAEAEADDRAVAEERAAVLAEAEALRRRAAANLKSAAARLLEVVTGRAP